MTDVLVRAVAQKSRARGPAYAVTRKFLEVQAQARHRGWFARFLGRSPLHPDARSLYKGALGELELVNTLDALGPGWSVLHGVPIAPISTEVDYLIIGPGGMFTIDAAHHAGRRATVAGRDLVIDGHSTDHIRTSVYEAAHTAKALAYSSGALVHVYPAIALVGVRSLSTARQQSPVRVLVPGELRAWLEAMPRRLSPDTVDYFTTIALNSATWGATGRAPDDATWQLHHFELIEHEVDRARWQARAVRIGAAVLALLSVAAVVLAETWNALQPI